jgi:hypothetical protein
MKELSMKKRQMVTGALVYEGPASFTRKIRVNELDFDWRKFDNYIYPVFEQNVAIYVTTESRKHLTFPDGKIVSCSETHNDHYGFLTSFEQFINEVNPKDTLPMVEIIITDVVISMFANEDSGLRELPSDWFKIGEYPNDIDTIQAFYTSDEWTGVDAPITIRNISKPTSFKIWQSDLSPEENQAMFSDLLEHVTTMFPNVFPNKVYKERLNWYAKHTPQTGVKLA